MVLINKNLALKKKILYKLLLNNVPKKEHPNRLNKLKIDAKFSTYCKQITWNEQKTMGKKITREKNIRENSVSLSEYDFMISV